MGFFFFGRRDILPTFLNHRQGAAGTGLEAVDAAFAQRRTYRTVHHRLKRIIGFLAGRKEAAKMASVYAKPRPGEIHRIVLSPQKIQQDLGWNSPRPLQDGLERTILSLRKA